MIPRYTRKKMAAVWEPENRFHKWLQIEVYAAEAMARMGVVPQDALQEIRKKAGFEVARIEEIEEITKHDVIAFLTAVGERVGSAARYLHLGLTSSDVLDTSLAMQLVEAAGILEEDLKAFLAVLRRRAFEHRNTPMIGRTHGMHAEPTTFGLKVAVWYAEMERNLERLGRARERVGFGKISGAVGTFAHLSPAVEESDPALPQEDLRRPRFPQDPSHLRFHGHDHRDDEPSPDHLDLPARVVHGPQVHEVQLLEDRRPGLLVHVHMPHELRPPVIRI